jgi:hypothetical protein
VLTHDRQDGGTAGSPRADLFGDLTRRVESEIAEETRTADLHLDSVNGTADAPARERSWIGRRPDIT